MVGRGNETQLQAGEDIALIVRPHNVTAESFVSIVYSFNAGFNNAIIRC